MNYHIVLAALSGVLEIVSLVPYLKDMIRGETRPNAVSFGIWTTLQVTAFLAQMSAGPSWSIVVVGMLVVSMSAITILALVGYGYRKYGLLDGACLAVAAMAIVAWLETGNPVLAIAFAIVGDLAAIVPTIVKTYKEPRSEHAGAWGLIALATLAGALSTEKFDIANLAFPIYLTVGNAIVFALAFLGRNTKPATS